MMEQTQCADCNATVVASGGTTGYAVTRVPRILFPAPARQRVLFNGENRGTADYDPTQKDGYGFLYFPSVYDVEGEQREHDEQKNGPRRRDGLPERRICYACCAVLERETMIANGRISLYLSELEWKPGDPHRGHLFTKNVASGLRRYTYELAGWPGNPSFRLLGAVRESEGYGFGHRYNVRTFRFAGPDGYVWSGRNAGDMQLARCKRTKERLSCH